MAYIEMKHSFKRYQVGDTEIVANHDISFEIEKGELVIIWALQVPVSLRCLISSEVWIPMMREIS